MSEQTLETPAAERAGDRHARRSFWVGFTHAAFVSAAGMVALLLVAVQTVWRGSQVAGGWFTQDDYLNVRDASLSPDNLTSPHAGEFSPVAKLLTWVAVQLGGTGWGAVALLVVLMQVVVALLVWVVLTQLLPGRWVRVPVLAVALFSPLTLSSTFSWAAAAMYLPAAICLLVAVAALLARQQAGWAPGARVAGVALLVALLCTDRAVVLPVLVLFVAAAAWDPSSLGLVDRLRRTLLTHLRLWLVVLVAVVARIVHGSFNGHASFGAPESSGIVLDVVQEYLRQVLSGIVGGPWRGNFANGSLDPTQASVFAVALLLGLVLALPFLRVARRPRVTTALVGVAVVVVLTITLLIMTRSDVSALGMVSRHAADAVLVLVLLGAAALRDVVVPTQLAGLVSRSVVGAAMALTLLVLVSSGVTQTELVKHLKNSDDRSFTETLAGDLERNPAVVLLDGPVPETILHPWFGKDAAVSTIAGLLPQQPTFGLPSEQLRLVDGLGILRKVNLATPVSAFADEAACANQVSSEPRRISFVDPAPAGQVVLEFDYLAGADVYVRVSTGREDVRVALRKGMAKMQIPITGGFSSVDVVLDADSVRSGVCLAQVRAGVPIQAPLTGLG